MSDAEPRDPSRSWWQTIPGILTGLAAIISAIAALIVALNSRPAAPAAGTSDPPAAGRAASTTTSPADSRPAASTIPRAVARADFPDGPQVTLLGGKLVLTMIDARVEPFNSDTRLLRLTIRWTNNDVSFVRNYWWTLRLVIDGVPRAPEDPGFEQVEARSARELAYVFKVPVKAGRFVLAIANDTGERAGLPIVLR